MRKILKIVIVLILVVSFSLPYVAMQANAAEQWIEYPTKSTGDVKKPWKITFSKQVNSKTVTNQNVYIEKANGTKVDVTVAVNGATITVTPKAAYTIGETYTLYLLSSIQSVEEKSLTNTKFQFKVMSALEIAKSVAKEAQAAAEAIKLTQPVFANPLAGTKDELNRADVLVANLEKAIADANEKVKAAELLITEASNVGVPKNELEVAKVAVTAAGIAITNAEAAIKIAKQAIEIATISSQLPISSVTVTGYETVQVTLAQASPYELSKLDSSKFRVNVDGEIVQVVDVVKDRSDDTRYTLTIASASSESSLIGKQGSLSVNNTKAIIKNSDYGYDFKVPTIDRVEVLDSLHLKINFSEKMHESAASIGNYDVVKSTATTTDILNSVGTVGVLSADRKAVTLTLSPNNPLVAGNYTLKVTGTINDAASNSLKINTTVEFSVTASQLVDITHPSLTQASYDSINGILNVTFDEKVTISSLSEFSLNGVSLTGAGTTATNESTSYIIKLSSANKQAVDQKLTNPLSLVISAGAVKDTATSPNSNLLQKLDLTVAIPPKAIEANYSEYFKLLRIKFDQPIQMDAVNISKISVVMNNSTRPLSGGKIRSTNANTLVIELTEEDSKVIEKNAGNSETGIVTMASFTVKNITEDQTANVYQNDIPLTYIQDTGKPSVDEIVLTAVKNLDNDTIEITFTKPMDPSSVMDVTKYKFESPTGTPITLTKDNTLFKMSEENSKVTLTLKGINLQYNASSKLTISNMMDLTGELLETYTGTNLKVQGDKEPPTIQSVSGSASDKEDIVTIYFTEAVVRGTAENIANYVIESPTATPISTSIKPTLMYTEIDSNNDGILEYKVEIKFVKTNAEEILKPGGKVTVKHSTSPETTAPITDLAGNAFENKSQVDLQTGDISDGVAPKIISVKGVTVKKGLDQIVIKFSENVNATTAINPNNYVLTVNGVPVSLTNLEENDITVKKDEVILLLDTNGIDNYQADDYALKNSEINTIKLTVNNLKDNNGNIIKAPNNVGEGSVTGDTSAGALDIDSKKLRVTSANTIQFVWDEELEGNTLQPTDFILINGSYNYPITEIKLDSTKKIVTLTTSKLIGFSDSLTLSLKEDDMFTNLAGNPVKKEDFNNVTVNPLGSGDAYSITGEKVEKASAPEYISSGENRQISDLYRLKVGTTTNDESFTIDSLSFDIKMTDGLLGLDKVQLMWSADEAVGNDVAVLPPKNNVGTAAGTLLFTDIGKEIISGGDGYFYVVADVSQPGKVTVILKDIKATTKQTKFKIDGKTKATTPATEVTIDTESPTAMFKSSNKEISPSGDITIIVKIIDNSPLASAKYGSQLESETNYKSLFNIVGNTNTNIIKSAKYSGNNNGEQYFTIVTSKGLEPNEYIRLIANQLIDAAGNPLAETLVAQGNGPNEAYVDPYELMNNNSYEKEVVQNASGSGEIIYGPKSGKKEVKAVTIRGNSNGPITLVNMEIKGNLIIDTPNASVNIGNNVKVAGTTTIQNASSIVVTNNGELNIVEIEDTGMSFINDGAIGIINVKSSDVKIGGMKKIPKLTIVNPATVELERNTKVTDVIVSNVATIQIGAGAVAEKLTVDLNTKANINNNGTIVLITGGGIAFVDGEKPQKYDLDIYERTAVAAIKGSTSVTLVEGVLAQYKEALGINLTDYMKLTPNYKATVNNLLFDNRKSYTKASDIKSAFNEEVNAQIAQSAVDTEVIKIVDTLSLSVGDKKYPEIGSAYTISVKSSTKSEIYNLNGEGLAPGISTVVYEVTYNGKKAEKTVQVTVTKRVTGVTGTASQVTSGKVPTEGTKEVNKLIITKGSLSAGKIKVTFNDGTLNIKEVYVDIDGKEENESAIANKIAIAFSGLNGYTITESDGVLTFTAQNAAEDKNVNIIVADVNNATGVTGMASQVTPGVASTPGEKEVNKLTVKKDTSFKSGTIIVTFSDGKITIPKEVTIDGNEADATAIATKIQAAFQNQLSGYEVTSSGTDVIFTSITALADKTVTITVADK